MTIREALAEARDSGFLRSVGVLVGGTSLAAAITACGLPVLTRFYAPSDFSVLAAFTALVSIISVAACLRFDVALSVAEKDSDAINILGLALLCTLAISTALAILVLSIPAHVLARFNQPALESYLWLLPLGVAFTGSYSAFQFWCVRKKEFAPLSRMRIAQALVGSGTQVSLGWLGSAPFGLLLGQTLYAGAGCIGLGYRIAATEGNLLRTVSWSQMRSMFFAYRRFPQYSALEALSNSAGTQLPIIMIAALAAGPEAGYLFLAMSVMQAPMGLVGNSIAQVYLSRAPDEFRVERLGAFTARVFGGLIKSGVGPLIAAGILAPDLFAYIFGEGWRRAGVLMSWMTPWFVMEFLASPVSMALHVANQQRAALLLQLLGLILRVLAVYCASLLATSLISEAYALSGFVFYFIYLALVFHVVHAKMADVVPEVYRGLPIVILWVVVGAVVALMI